MSKTRRADIEDLALALGLMVLALIPLGVPALQLSELHRTAAPGVAVGLTLLQTLPLAVRRRFPVPTLAVIGAAWAAAQLLGTDTGLAGAGLVIALWTCGRYQQRNRIATVVVGTVAYAVLAVALAYAGSPERIVVWVTFWVVLAAPWCAATVLRVRQHEQDLRARLLARQAVADATTAIAEDLHDVVTHHVTAMVLQAESTVFATDGLPQDDRSAALESIGGSGRAALQELRALLDTLDPTHVDDSPQKATSLEGLVERLQIARYPITLTAEIDRSVSPASAAVLHEVAREAVTNAMKHAPGMPIRLELVATNDGSVELRIDNALAGDSAPHDLAHVGGGRGHTIMAARVADAGGTFEAGRGTGRTYRTVVRLPAVQDDTKESRVE